MDNLRNNDGCGVVRGIRSVRGCCGILPENCLTPMQRGVDTTLRNSDWRHASRFEASVVSIGDVTMVGVTVLPCRGF